MGTPLSELIRRRRALKERITQMAVELDALDRLIFPRMTKMAEAAEGGTPRSAPKAPDASFRNTNAAFHAAEPVSANRLWYDTNGNVVSVNGNGVMPMPTADMPTLGPIMGTNTTMVPITETITGTASYTGYGTVFRASSAPASITDGAYELLEKAGTAMKAGVILRSLLDQGIAVPGQRPINNLSAHLSNDDRFVSTKDGWTLRTPSLLAQPQENPTQS